MKKILVLGLTFALFTVAASAQKGSPDKGRYRHDFSTGQMTHAEKSKLHKNRVQYRKMEHRFKRDGRISPAERRQLNKMKKTHRHQAYRFKHNGRKRVR